ncbi:MAG: ATP-binding cassette domain-containing protein [Coprobacillus sp.]|nr:ATP-binding cassette domain-containing protein [Coprobacillus sp.]CCY08059.1 aBC-type Cobalt import ATP-binding protein CbiO 2 [Coprobacillus sp. CAG:698]
MGINFSKVNYTYAPQKKKVKNKYILEDINLTISEKNEFITIVGHTGSGKSTLVQMMNALLVPTTGSVTVFGNEITYKKQKNLKRLRKNVGLVFQFPEYQLFEETVLKDVCFGPKNYKLENPVAKAKEALTSVKIYEDKYEKSPFRLSGGEKRKVAIAGILASEPNVLILDEPTVGLDPQTKKELLLLLKEINKEKTIIIITHDMNALWEVSTRVIVLDDKKIVYDGDKYTLFKNEELVRKHSLDYPDIIKIMNTIKEKTGKDMDVYKENIDDAFDELLKVFGNE